MTATNVNTATAAELDAVGGLQGHGPEIARSREERGGFSDLRQLEQVPSLVGKIDGVSAVLTVGKRWISALTQMIPVSVCIPMSLNKAGPLPYLYLSVAVGAPRLTH